MWYTFGMENERLKQGDKILLKITGTGINGEGVGRVGNFVVFVPLALPEETVNVRVTYVKRNFANAVLIDIVTPSAKRVKPVCNRFGRCGGCAYLHLEYEEQLVEKRKNLIETLKKNARYEGDVSEVVPSKPFGYRNKLQLPFGWTDGAVSLGFYKTGTHKVVSTGRCDLNGAWAEKLITVVKQWANAHRLSVYSEENRKGLLRHLVARYLEGKLQVTLVLNGEKIPFKNELYRALSTEFSDVGLYLSVNRGETNVILGDRLVPIETHEQTFNVLGIEAELNPLSFLQVNNEIRDKLYLRVIKEILDGGSAEKTENIVVDAYAGIGILGAVLAKRGVRVENIEIVSEAVQDADRLAERNGVADFIKNTLGDAAELLPRMLPSICAEHPDASVTVVLDPPRKGCDRKVLEALVDCADIIAPKIIYISCNPATLSRDLSVLQEKFTLCSVEPYDMFPGTPHIETMVVLVKKR